MKSAPIRGVITMLPALTPTQTVSVERRHQVGEPGLAHPVARKVASPLDQEDVGLLPPKGTHRGRPRRGQCGELEQADRGPAEADHRVARRTEPERLAGPAPGWP